MFQNYSRALTRGTLILAGVTVALFGSTLVAKPRLQTGPDTENCAPPASKIFPRERISPVTRSGVWQSHASRGECSEL